MTTTSTKRIRSPKSFVRKDARNKIYRFMYGQGDKRSLAPPAFDLYRRHANPDKVSWSNVKQQVSVFWREARFDELTANKIISDFNVYAKGVAQLSRSELEAVSS